MLENEVIGTMSILLHDRNIVRMQEVKVEGRNVVAFELGLCPQVGP